MSGNKTGSKLAQGVRQVMEKQVSSPQLAKKAVAPSVPAGKAPPASVKKATSVPVTNKTQSAQQVDERAILHPSRVWPD